MYWHRTLEGDKPSDKADPIDPGHVGPTLAYLAKVDDAKTEHVTGLKCMSQIWSLISKWCWKLLGFKVHEDGWDSNHQWGVTRMYKNRGKVAFKVPTCIKPGQYVLQRVTDAWLIHREANRNVDIFFEEKSLPCMERDLQKEHNSIWNALSLIFLEEETQIHQQFRFLELINKTIQVSCSR